MGYIKNSGAPCWIAGLILLVLIIPINCFAATGGPDTFGYTWADQDEPLVTYNFIDISTTGTQIFDGDDVASGSIALQRPFSFYGTNYTQLNISSNGYISTDLTEAGRDLTNDCPLPHVVSSGGGARLYPLHDDLVSTGYVQYFSVCPRPSEQSPGESCTIFMWHTRHYLGTQYWDQEAILYHQTGNFVFQIGPGNPELGAGSTTGIQNLAADDGLAYASCDTASSIADQTAVCFFNPRFSVPTLSEWGFILLILLLVFTTITTLRKRSVC